MNEEILKLADLSNVKVGDTIWTIQDGYEEVTAVGDYNIETQNYFYNFDGKYQEGDKHPSAFLSNPFENVGFQERWMMVSNDQIVWHKRKVLIQKNGKFIAWTNADTDEKVLNVASATDWKYAKEIEEPKELTLEERIERLEKLNKL